ncbi:MAG TPA: AsmA family protein [Noviherbaspirillum sp.]|jgi:uncharacterized protein involved in outer membrane biogenesis|uniref:AsmA family protein n=1 Tax=Noviherbaspirillum sp. TaxID=1926288 RepID=UPI002F9470A2
MNRAIKIIAVGLAVLVALLVLLVALAASFDWNRAKPWINEKVSAATGREFAINGDLSLNWERPPEEQHGWRRLVPWPHLRMNDAVLGNAEWAKTGPQMAKIAQADVSLNLLPLLRRTISVDYIVLTEPDLVLEKSEDDKNNWTFPKKDEEPQQDSKWALDVNHLTIREGKVRYVDPVKFADATVHINTTPDGAMTFRLDGKFNDEKLSGGGKTGSLLALRESGGHRYPVQAEVKVGGTTITADGTLTDPTHPSALDINLKILGASMADLFPLSGVVLPETPKFSTEGRVAGTFEKGRMRIRYEKFKGRVGDSDIGGTLEYQQQEPRPILRGEVTSNMLNLKDLGAMVGSGDDNNKKKDEPKIPPGKVLPVSPFKTERWGKIDVQVTFAGKKIVRSEALPIDNLHTSVRLENGVLSLAPLDFSIAGGKLTAELSINGSAEPAKARMKVSARGLKLKEMFPAVEEMDASIGQINGDAQLTAAGNSVAALLASMNGEVKSLVSQGSVSKFILEAAGLNVGSAVIAKVFGDRQVPLNCMAVDLAVNDGILQPRIFLLDTADATIRVEGNVSFRDERMNLTVLPDSKGIRVISLRSPLYVGGTFKNPDVGVDKGVIALKAGAAAVLGTVAAPFAALLALINPGPAGDPPCKALLAEAAEKPQAPPPGKRTTQRQGRE